MSQLAIELTPTHGNMLLGDIRPGRSYYTSSVSPAGSDSSGSTTHMSMADRLETMMYAGSASPAHSHSPTGHVSPTPPQKMATTAGILASGYPTSTGVNNSGLATTRPLDDQECGGADESCQPPKKRRVNFNLTLDIKQEEEGSGVIGHQSPQSGHRTPPDNRLQHDDACVPVAATFNNNSLAPSHHSATTSAESYYSDLPAFPTTPHGGPQVPPLTPGTNLKVGEALKATYATWNDKTRQLGIPRDPRLWQNIEVIAWLDWAANEFQLYSDSVTNFIRTFRVSDFLFFQ